MRKKGLELTDDERDCAWTVDWRREYGSKQLTVALKSHGRSFEVFEGIFRENRYHYDIEWTETGGHVPCHPSQHSA